MAKRLPDIFEDMRLALLGRKKDHNWGESAKDTYQASVAGIKGVSSDTLEKTTQNLNDALPFIERAGFETTEIEVGLGLSPRVIAHLHVREILTQDEQQDLIEETKKRKIINTILISLFKAAATHKKMRFPNYSFTHMELELSIMPTVSLKFRPNGTSEHDILDGDESDQSLPAIKPTS